MTTRSLDRLYRALNREFWGGRLPMYSVVRKDAKRDRLYDYRDDLAAKGKLTDEIDDRIEALADGGVDGWCDSARRIIFVDWLVMTPELERQILLQEMCHAATPGEAKTVAHGPRFVRQLERLAARGETWASGQAERYRNE